MPSSVYTRDGYIRFNNIQLQDAGRYLCRARNNAGEAEATADVIVEGKDQSTLLCLIPRHQTIELTHQQVFQYPSYHLREEDKTKQIN